MNEPLIVSDPAVMMGKPVIAGTRITVELILEKMASGETIEQILDAHPRLTRQSVLAAIEYANRILRSDIVHPMPWETAWRAWAATHKCLPAFAEDDRDNIYAGRGE